MAKLALLTSGGDAPGMNAAIRAVVRSATARGLEVIGVRRGYEGLLTRQYTPLDSRSVANIVHLGGTVLQTSRCEEFKTKAGRAKALHFLKEARVDYLITIGGNGTTHGATALQEEGGIKVVCVPSTIDNDVYGTDYTIGFDTAVNTAVEAIDRIRDTAFSLERLFFVEVMGRDAGFIALEAGIAGGATEVLVPETPTSIDGLCTLLETSFRIGKKSIIVVVAEGDVPGGALEIARQVKKQTAIDSRVCILGHVQRGGAPSAWDRILASKFGLLAVEALLQGKFGVVVGEVKGEITYTPIRLAFEKRKTLNSFYLELLKTLSG